MGIQVEFNPDLALREYGTEGRMSDECLPAILVRGRIHHFLKKGQRNYFLLEKVPLRTTRGEGELSRPRAAIRITNPTHIIFKGEIWTEGKYRIEDVFDPDDPTIHFESCDYRDQKR